MNCPFCQEPCQEEDHKYSNTSLRQCSCQSPFRNFICDVYKINQGIHQFWIHLPRISLHFITFHNQWNIYTIDNIGTLIYIATGKATLNPDEALSLLRRYDNLLVFS